MSNQLDVIKKLNESVGSVLSKDGLVGFEKAYKIAEAVQQLKDLLTSEYMKPILALQGNKLGFKTDKDREGGYSQEVVKNCLIEAVLTGVQPFGNQFNIISGNCYITKEGFGYLLANYPGLSYDIVPQLPRIKDGSAAVVMDVEWTLNSATKKKSIDIPVKVNQHMGADAVLGKATRKARAWLYNSISGTEIADGDIQDVDATVVGSKMNESINLEDLQFLYEAKKAALTEAEQKDAERILNNKEEKSYSKLHKHLRSK